MNHTPPPVLNREFLSSLLLRCQTKQPQNVSHRKQNTSVSTGTESQSPKSPKSKQHVVILFLK